MPVALQETLNFDTAAGGGGGEDASAAPVTKASYLTSNNTTTKLNNHNITVKEVNNRPEVPIYDIRSSKDSFNLREDILNGLQVPEGHEKTMPTMLLYDSAGLKEFERITYAEEYYLTNAEIQVLETHAEQIAQRIEDGGILVELGSGNLRKVNILLKALERAQKNVEYYALDLSLPELQRTFSDIHGNDFKYVKCHGLHGTYDDGREWLISNDHVKNKQKCILWMGSSIGNFDRNDGADFVRTFANKVLRPGAKDFMLIGIDACKDPVKVWHAYNDVDKITEDFIMNGLVNANGILKENVFNRPDWDYIGECDVENGRHQAFYGAREDVHLGRLFKNLVIKKGEKVRVERSYKYSAKESTQLWEDTGLIEGAKWGSRDGEYNLHMVYKPAFSFSLKPNVYAKAPLPNVEEWKELWASWDLVAAKMIPVDKLNSKPIKLRNPCIFYAGHIPTFLDIHLTRALKGGTTEPSNYPLIFERGIDPDVDNPESCHRHSEIPDSWPDIEEIRKYQDNVRERLLNLYETDHINNVGLQRSIWLAFEHEAMHLETLLYMLIQREQALAPPGVPTPDFKAAAMLDELNSKTDEDWLQIPVTTIKSGCAENEETGGFFTWDNEHPQRTVKVDAFKAHPRPITNEEYATYIEATNLTTYPESWATEAEVKTNTHTSDTDDHNNGHTSLMEKRYIKTVFGLVPLVFAKHWPVMGSYDELSACAKWLGGRIPTREELQSIYEYVETAKVDLDAKKLAGMFDAVNGHLSMHGVHISPPSTGYTPEGPEKNHLFSDLSGANVSFKHWHPLSVAGKLCGRGDAGLWEWTSSPLATHEGFEPMELYPEYTADFFDSKHYVCLGGSWATHSRIAGRKSFVNWYQRNYPYTWCTARLVKDN